MESTIHGRAFLFLGTLQQTLPTKVHCCVTDTFSLMDIYCLCKLILQ